MLNSFSGIGRLSADPDSTSHGETLQTRFTLNINEFFKIDNDLSRRTHRIPCKAHGRLAEICQEFLAQGSQVGVRGQLMTENGRGEKEMFVRVNELEFLSSKPSENPY